MSAKCCHNPHPDQHWNDAGYKKVLWVVLAINAAMFLVEVFRKRLVNRARAGAGFMLLTTDSAA